MNFIMSLFSSFQNLFSGYLTRNKAYCTIGRRCIYLIVFTLDFYRFPDSEYVITGYSKYDFCMTKNYCDFLIES